MKQLLIFLLISFGVSMIIACGPGEVKPAKPAPASQSHPVKETELNTITLTDQAVQRLGIVTTEIQESSVGNSRFYSGEIVPVPGKMITLTAPVAGTLMAAGNNISAGQQVRKGQQLYRLLILPAERDLLSAQEEVAQREVQYNTSSEKLKRTARMYEEKSGSLRARQEAEAELATVAAQLRMAKSRVELLRGDPSAATSRMSTLNLQAPISGTIMKVYSSPSQVLSPAAPIVDIVSLNPVWVRVPLYAGDESRIDKGASALVQNLSGGTGTSIRAKTVTGPQTSDPLATSIDLYYEIDNSRGDFRPGQKVSITIPFAGNATGNLIPFSAIVYDIQGGTWVYNNTSPNTFVRERVELQSVIENRAVLSRGPKPGSKIVTIGVAELFGTEFGGGK